jgi:hypothetical protein
MGNFYVNFTARGPERELVTKSLWSAKREAFVAPCLNGLTVFFDEQADAQDDAVIKDLGQRVSNDLRAPVLAVLNHDDDILMYWLFDAGQLADEYNSCPGYFTGGDVSPVGGEATIICAAFQASNNASQVNKVLCDQKYVFAFERHRDLSELLNHPWPFVCLGYRDIVLEEFAGDVTKKDFQHVSGA